MAVGTKTTEFAEQASMALTDEFLVNINNGSGRIPKGAIPELAAGIAFLTAGDVVDLTREDHYRRFINMNNTDGDVQVNLPDIATVPEYGLFCTLGGTSGDNDLIVTGPEGILRAAGPFPEGPLSIDTVYLGATRALGDECIATIYRRGGLWTLDCNTGVRSSSDGDQRAISAGRLLKEIDLEAAENRVITDADHGVPVWLTATDPGQLSFAAELSRGLMTSVVNDSDNTVTVDFTGHTQVGSVNAIGARQAATIIVGDLVSGTNRRIIVKASS